jgi:uracil-DNA glycosylase
MSEKLKEVLGSWYDVLAPEFEKPYMREISSKVYRDRAIICPDVPDIFNFLRLTPLEEVKVLVISKDPYTNGEAEGIAFSSKKKEIAPSLGVIYQELDRTHNIKRLTPSLRDWAMSGVFLLNVTLTAEKKKSGSHESWGWDRLTGLILRTILKECPNPTAIMLWGDDAKRFYYNNVGGFPAAPRKVLEAIHPARQLRSGGKYQYVGCGHFLLADEFHKQHGVEPINW